MKVSYDPYSELVVKEIIKYRLDEFIKEFVPLQNVTIKWCDGVAMVVSGIPMTPEIVRDLIGGKVYWNVIEFTYMPQYTEMIKAMVGNGQWAKPVLNVSHNLMFCMVAKFLKEHAAFKEDEIDAASIQKIEHDGTPCSD